MFRRWAEVVLYLLGLEGARASDLGFEFPPELEV